MTTERAIEILTFMYKANKLPTEKKHKADPLYQDYVIALNIAISALEKQTPKKPIEKGIAKLRFPGVSFCPTCDNPVIKDESDNYEQAYCCYCGQALDWRESNV